LYATLSREKKEHSNYQFSACKRNCIVCKKFLIYLRGS
jgi:hypothetical protein